MKLLLDANLSPELVRLLDDVFPGSAHVLFVGLGSAPTDESLWDHAKAYGFVIVSKDTDFYTLSMLRGAPPKIVWLRLGNGPTSIVEVSLRDAQPKLIDFVADPASSLFVLGNPIR